MGNARIIARLRRAWALGLWAGVAACGPRLTDRPERFIGDDNVQIAILCSDAALKRGEAAGMWIKTIVQAQPGAEVDWANIMVRTQHVDVVRAAVGRVSRGKDGVQYRINTYWVTARAGAATAGRVGPIEASYVGGAGRQVTVASEACPLELR